MSVCVGLCGRLGNNLFQYAFGRIIAQGLGFELRCRPIRGASGPGSFAGSRSAFLGAPLRISGVAHRSVVQDWSITASPDWDGQTIDLGAVLKDVRPRRIRLLGFFQRYTYYRAYKARIRDWFATKPSAWAREIGRNDVLVDLRLGEDFAAMGWRMPPEYQLSILETLSDVERVFVVGPDVDDQTLAKFRRFSPIRFHHGPIENFAFMQAFRRMVLSNSTFSWWASFLSPMAEAVYGPVNPTSAAYSFHNSGGVDLRTDEPRFLPVTCWFEPQTRLRGDGAEGQLHGH